MKNAVITVIIAALVAFGIGHLSRPTSTTQTKETVYERVQRTGVLRCGYNIEPPMMVVDPNTNEKSGATHDIVERAAALIGWKVEWAEQVGWGEMTAGLLADRYDLVCNGKWVFAPQAKGGEFTMPLYYTAVYAYGRADEMRVAGDLSNLNGPTFTVTSMDGEINYHIAHDKFPDAKKLEFPTMTDNAMLIQAILAKKADVTFMAAFLGDDYMAKHPGTLKRLTAKPVAVFDTAFMYKVGESAFGATLNTALRELHGNGFIESTLDKYNVAPTSALRMAQPYKLPE